VIPWSTVVVNTHDRQRYNMFGNMERLSELDTSLVGEGAPSEAFADSLTMGSKLRSNKDQRFRLTSDNSDLSKGDRVQGLFSQVIR
jgi:hypothetical protein